MTALLILLLFLILVTVHELGHYLAARLCGVRVLAFSVGMGPELFGFNDRSGTRWRLAALPIGGYVQLYGNLVHPDEAQEIPQTEQARAFPFKPLWQRALIVFAGPLANILLGIVVSASVLSLVVQSVPPSQIGSVPPASAAAQAGLEVGDRLVMVNGQETLSWSELVERLSQAAGTSALLEVEALNGRRRMVELDLSLDGSAQALKAEGITAWGLYPALVVSEVMSGLPAQGALQPGDLLLSVNNQPLRRLSDLSAAMQGDARLGYEPLNIEILRRGVAIQLSVTPVWQEASQRPLIGVQIGGDWVLRSYTPLEAVVEGFRQAGELAVAVPRQLTRVISGVLPTDALSGPVGIVETSNRVVSNGWWAFWLWLSLLSFNLAIVNLLPLPVLDGGHLLFYAIEAVARRPLPVAVQSALMRLGVALLLGLFVALTLQDVLALLR